MVRAKPPQRLPVVLTRQEVIGVLDRMSGLHGLMARLLYVYTHVLNKGGCGVTSPLDAM